MPWAEITGAVAVVAYIELRVKRALDAELEQLHRETRDAGGRRRVDRYDRDPRSNRRSVARKGRPRWRP